MLREWEARGGAKPRRDDANCLHRAQCDNIRLANLAGRGAGRRLGIGLIDDRPDGGDATPAI
jgi:hypothetical protein